MGPSFETDAALLRWEERFPWGEDAARMYWVPVARVLWRYFSALFALTRAIARNLSKAARSKHNTSWSTGESTRCRSPCVTTSLEEASVAPTVVAISV